MCFGSSVCLWRNVCVDLPIFSVGSLFLNIELNELFVCLEMSPWSVPLFANISFHPMLSYLWYLAEAKAHESHFVFFLYSFLSFFVAVLGLLAERALSGCSAWASHCSGSSYCPEHRLQGSSASESWFPGSGAQKPSSRGHRLSSRGHRASWLCPTWHLPKPGTEPVSTALVGGFFTTEPQGNPVSFCCFGKLA